MGLNARWALEICAVDEDGNSWDFTKPEMRKRTARKVIDEKPFVLVGGPPCTDWSSLMNRNLPKMDPAEVEMRNGEARVHLEFCMTLYNIQHEHCRYFLRIPCSSYPITSQIWSYNSPKIFKTSK